MMTVSLASPFVVLKLIHLLDVSIFALVAWFACFAIFTLDIHYGFGKHIWDVSLADYSPHFLLMWTLSAIVYIIAMLSVKFSILMLYRRLFPIENFSRRWWAVTLFTFGYSFGGIMATIFTCIPVQAAWYVRFFPNLSFPQLLTFTNKSGTFPSPHPAASIRRPSTLPMAS